MKEESKEDQTGKIQILDKKTGEVLFYLQT